MFAMVRVKAVEPLEEFLVKLTFSDETCKVKDLAPLLDGQIFEALKRDRELFRAVAVDEELGTIVWPNGADICPDVLRWDRVPAAFTGEDSSAAR